MIRRGCNRQKVNNDANDRRRVEEIRAKDANPTLPLPLAPYQVQAPHVFLFGPLPPRPQPPSLLN